MRLGLVTALAVVTLLSGCEVFMDGLGFEIVSRDAMGSDTALAAPDAYAGEGS